MTWTLTNSALDQENLLINESLFSLGNGYLGVRGNFEEGYQDNFKSIRGTYINAFHDEIQINYGEKLFGFPEKQQKLVNIIDGQAVQIYIDGERFSLFSGEVISYERKLHMDKGFSERIIQWKSPAGKIVKFHFKRLVSFVTKELFLIDLKVEPVTPVNEIKIISTINGDVTNFVDKNDPRVASSHAKLLHVTEVKQEGHINIIKSETENTKLEVACATTSNVSASNYTYETNMTVNGVEEVYIANGPTHFTKFNIYTDTYRHGRSTVEEAITIQNRVKGKSFATLLEQQQRYLNDFWEKADVKISGDQELQQGIRFNLYQLLQSVGKDPYSNISAKGLSGEGYEGHYFWDTEIYIFPVFLMTDAKIAKNLLLHRYSILDSARERAREMGHKKGALFPWRTITGPESSAFFPAGTAQYHISADIAYSFIQYYLVTKDENFLKEYMAEVLFETARLWVDTGHFLNGEFRIDNVTGPDEYTCIVNNNYYTNVMAKHNLLWAAKTYQLLKKKDPLSIEELTERLQLTENEVIEWQEAGEKMFLPYDDNLKITAQDDTFLQKDRWDFDSTPKEKYPLLLHYHPLTLYRYQVCKQADTVLAHFLLEDEQDFETMKNSYDYYEQVTTHDSSLSHCAFSIMASKLGYKDKAYNYFIETARLDLDNTHGNTKDGLHMANMGGTWLAIVYGFAGVRVKESGISFTPSLPEQWTSLEFNVQYQDRLIKVMVEKEKTTYTNLNGEGLEIVHQGEKVYVESGSKIECMN
ncbi:glycoside hydrolase family 65 protein [Ornithinibacillus halotolerans]|uniref:Glycosyl hydrolase n=1 Tax=Ornithinibacillus halotolerans TaxID=1274357 RepID=A0A916W6N1_9BACI|nr:glycoside hydrolase family 65 protein [Ornithinibacillus halotolerans]GGA71531.1 glycosyl hydrolase [Ornithinibacillus halotolerans]